jgi:dihydroflavonol-4-reductase
MSKVLVTGGSGFVGSHAIAQLLAAGHEVRTTVRKLSRAPAGVEAVVADLTSDSGWAAAMQGCDFVLHVASPMASAAPKDENELIAPARDGTVRVLRFARDAGVKRVVVTSSFAAIGYGHPPQERLFTEGDWTDPAGADVQPYMRSKVLAERAAWEFIEREGNGLELSVINPVGIFGPALGPDLSDSIRIVQQMLNGGIPICPQVYFGVVDVRDVVDLHLRAMIAPEARGERFLAVAGDVVSLLDVANILRARLGAAAQKAPRRQLPNWLVRAMALVMPPLREVVPQLGIVRRSSNAKAKRVLGWSPRSNEDAIAATGESLLRLKS